MPLHLLKLCVGCDGIADLEDWIRERLAKRPKGSPRQHVHVTRMTPKRGEELLDGGSLYWVIRGEIACRQTLVGIEPFVDGEGVGRCRLLLEPTVVPVEPRPYRAFQGWRYLAPKDAPSDLARSGKDVTAMPEEMRRELRSLGLL
ncbi:MAG: DUF1489 domain-containing protein [Rhodoplanes sp.]|uniref:DUF1489 family protein n=1 Tax=Rhodoplanes sp. TaxID=1968906 RepID=UPI0017F08E93|nr:DUF1489 domain-containing protein [Rhodoplanes sp.]NVO17067.1 DUF1489 domain-containing protein [Rhodoplanes sp.]